MHKISPPAIRNAENFAVIGMLGAPQRKKVQGPPDPKAGPVFGDLPQLGTVWTGCTMPLKSEKLIPWTNME